jgi:metallophosphoesterase (TIGR00282 family)
VRILFIGDIVGKPGLKIVERAVPQLRRRESLDLVIANAENIADGSGMTPKHHTALRATGVDCITLGDHIYRRKEIMPLLDAKDDIVRPANYPADAPGKPWIISADAQGRRIAVISLLGRVFMKPVDCPFTAADRVLQELPNDLAAIFVDFHAEATSDMQLMGRYLDGRVSAVLGTHTHVPTADEQIFPGGTAFQCDVGMTGPYESILGRRIERVQVTTLTFRPTQFVVATEDPRLSGAIVEVDTQNRKATSIRRVVVNEETAIAWSNSGE